MNELSRAPIPLIAFLASWITAGCATGGSPPPADALHPTTSQMIQNASTIDPTARVTLDEASSQVVLVAGPFSVPASGGPGEGHHAHHGDHGDSAPRAGHEHEHRSPLISLEWPVDGWMRGFRVALYGADGQALPRSLLHHLITVNFDRRQPVYPVAERLFGVGQETEDFVLPHAFGVPLHRGTELGVYASWHNDTGQDLHEVYLEVRIPYHERGREESPREVLPIYMDVNNVIGDTNAYDLPPGPSERSFEFQLPVGGRLLGVGGHLHDHGIAVRLEDAETGKTLAKVEGIRDPAGSLVGVEQKVLRRLFGLLDTSVRLEAGRRYRVVGVYHNPLDNPIPMGAMAHMVGVFEPDEWTDWIRLDRASPLHQVDLAGLPEPLSASGVRGESAFEITRTNPAH